MNIVLTIIGISVATYIALMVLLYLRQSSHLYYPTHEIESTPDKLGLEYESVMFDTSDEIQLNGWYLPHENSERLLLFFHGNSGNISHCMESIEMFHGMGFNVFIFDYRGYGLSHGKPSERGTYCDAEAAWNYVTHELGFSENNILILGRSLGAAIASHLTIQHSPKALVLESTFTSMPDIAAELYWYVPARLLTTFDYDVVSNISQIKYPVLIVHSNEDKVITIDHGRKIYNAAEEPKQFLEIEGNHYDGFLSSGQKYTDGLTAFVNSYM